MKERKPRYINPATYMGTTLAALEWIIEDIEGVLSYRFLADKSPVIDVRGRLNELILGKERRDVRPPVHLDAPEAVRFAYYRELYLETALQHCADVHCHLRDGKGARARTSVIKAARAVGCLAGFSQGMQMGIRTFLGREHISKRWGPNRELREFVVRRYEEEARKRPPTQQSANYLAKFIEKDVRQERDRLQVILKDEELQRRCADWIRSHSPLYKQSRPQKQPKAETDARSKEI